MRRLTTALRDGSRRHGHGFAVEDDAERFGLMPAPRMSGHLSRPTRAGPPNGHIDHALVTGGRS
ncbi:hypothetical protein ABT160_08055 [Streptomyces sp. NPDC001941]|uniref:hypothetical protein n=1 Tax=Streptomyces sp. NPDC001941 TaxID=3154659 RepID=UPI003327E3E8